MIVGALRLVLGDQLTRNLSSLQDIDTKLDHVLMVEVHDETVYVKHHKQKITLLLSAMRHFARTSSRDQKAKTFKAHCHRAWRISRPLDNGVVAG